VAARTINIANYQFKMQIVTLVIYSRGTLFENRYYIPLARIK